MMDAKALKKLIDRYQQKADTAYRNYQESGVSRYDREYRNNEDLADALRVALNANDEHTQLISIRSDLATLAGAAEQAVHHHDISEVTSVLNNLIAVASTYGVYGRRY